MQGADWKFAIKQGLKSSSSFSRVGFASKLVLLFIYLANVVGTLHVKVQLLTVKGWTIPRRFSNTPSPTRGFGALPPIQGLGMFEK